MFVHAKARISRKADGSDALRLGGRPSPRLHRHKLCYFAEECQEALADFVVFAWCCCCCVRSWTMIQVTSDSGDTPRQPRLCQAAGDLQYGCRSAQRLWSEESWPYRGLRTRSTHVCGASTESTESAAENLTASQGWSLRSKGDSSVKRAHRETTFGDSWRQDFVLQMATGGRVLPGWRSPVILFATSESKYMKKLMSDSCHAVIGATYAGLLMRSSCHDGEVAKTTTKNDKCKMAIR